MVTETFANGTHLGEFHGIPATGNKIQGSVLHIWEFEGDKIRRATEYADMASILVQLGVMPPPEPLELVPSFTLPDAEPTGLSPVEAHAECISRLNTHDLSLYAKIIHPDAEIIAAGVPMDRDAEVALEELYLLAFPDVYTDLVRSIDMGDGWVVNELVFTGTNDGPYLGIPATGNSITLRGVALTRYDADGLQTNLNLYFDNLTMMAQLGLVPPPVPEPPPTVGTCVVTVERLGAGAGVGPEDVAVDAQGRLYGSMKEGGIMRFQPDGSGAEVFAEVMAAGLHFDADGNLVACVGRQGGGVISIAPDGSITELTPEELDGVSIRLTNDVDIAADGTIYFSNSTTSPDQIAIELFGGQPAPNGHLFAYDPTTETTRQLLDNLWFANGVAVSPDGSFVLVNESSAFRVTRYWLTGPKQGESDVFIENLPGQPDGISSDGEGMFWLAVVSNSLVFGLDMDGNIVNKLYLQKPSGQPYGFVTSVQEHEGTLYLGNLADDAIGRLSIIPEPLVEDFTRVFFMPLEPGLNMVSLPLQPITPYTARSFAEEISATTVIKLDEARQRFVGFTLDAPDDGFTVEGGKGYIVNVPEGAMATFVGTAWTNNPPMVLPAPPLADSDSAWAFVVSGIILESESHVPSLHSRTGLERSEGSAFTVTVRNIRTNAVATDVPRSGYFAAAFADLTRKNVVEVGDQLKVTVRTDEFVSEPFLYTVTPENIRQANLSITLKNVEIPRRSMLLQNYPNPFNPETWIPYQLREPAEVVIRIYNTTGQLVHTLDLGQHTAGFYLSRTRAAYWDGNNDAGEKVASGTYFYQIKAGNFSATRKMIIVK
jgi:predicted ester cyclase